MGKKHDNYFRRIRTEKFFIYIVLVFLVLICLVPIWLMFVNATRSTVEIQNGISIFPSKYAIKNFNLIQNKGVNILRGILNSFIIASLSTILNVYFSLMTAYAIEVYNFKFKHYFQKFIYVLVMIPGQISIIGYFQYMSKLGLINSYIPLIIPAIAAPAQVFFAKQYLESCIVRDLIDSGRIDGCSELGIFHRIMMPIARPGMFTMGIFSFVGSWNNLMSPFVLLSDMKKYTLPMMIKTLRGDQYKTEYGAIYLGLAISIVPIMIVYCTMAKKIVAGVSMGAVKE